MRTCYDAITPGNIPANAQMVAGYVDGRYAWSAADWARFPHSVKARIAVFSSTNDGHILDVEPGCSTPANAPGWVVRRRKAGIDPTVYCSLSAWPTVRAAFAAAKVAEPHWWIAAYPGNGAALYPGAVAHQYANPGPVDISVAADYWPGVDPTPIKPPEVDMTPAEHAMLVTAAKFATAACNRAQDLQVEVAALRAEVAVLKVGPLGVTPAVIAKAVNDDAVTRRATWR